LESCQTTASFYKYWGKLSAQPDPAGTENPYHLLVFHSLDVAAVCYELLSDHFSLVHDLADLLEVSPKEFRQLFAFIIVLHDLGKFASAFQGLAPSLFPDLKIPTSRKEYDGARFRHDRLGAYFWWEISNTNPLALAEYEHLSERERGRVDDVLRILMECSLGHHGQPVDHDEIKKIKRSYTTPHNLDAAVAFTKEMVTLFKPSLPVSLCLNKDWRTRLEQISWHLAGLAVLSDWVGSDSSDFPYKCEPVPLEKYWRTAREKAVCALRKKELTTKFSVKQFGGIKDCFKFDPTPLQSWAESVSVDNTPQLFILEDVTGAGKTEAALALTQRLMAAGAADGFYFGLPTMATSNAMFGRVANHYLQMYETAGDAPSIVLAHGAREMSETFRDALKVSAATDGQYEYDESKKGAGCNQWFADSRKKALLVPVGVGTIDQALIAVLPRRHQSLRVYGLYRKVLIFDEVHAADEYMFQLLEGLLKLHLHQGGSVILLTATLPLKQRERLTEIWQKAAYLEPQLLQITDFPLATKVSVCSSPQVLEQKLESRADVSREVAVQFIDDFDTCTEKIVAAAADGQCVVWVRNSVDDAVEAYRKISALLSEPKDVLLFHSRFILDDRKAIEERVLHLFGKESTGEIRCGKVLIATQVFQESLDVDCDLLVSDICPIDDLIQRAGRLHRHTRNVNGAYEQGITDCRPAPQILIQAPEWDENPSTDWLSRNFRNTGFVYRSPGRLWLGMRVLRKLGAIRMPGEARQLIESVYGEDAYNEIPEKLIRAENELIGTIRSNEAKARDIMLDWHYGYCARSGYWHEDNIEISTRFSDLDSVEVVVFKTTDDGELIPWAGNGKFAIQLSTVKLAKNSYADKLQPFPESLETQRNKVETRYRQMKYRQCWLPDTDPLFTYQATVGFCKRQEQEQEEM
jgi:CRISPR-associated endonuclease/helicase Cas3